MKNIFNIPTPFVKVNLEKLYHNIKKIQYRTIENNSILYPHFKTHKSMFIAKKQIENGASGITCAKISEAEILVENGIENLILAYPIVSSIKLNRLLNIYEKANISIIIDSFHHAEILESFFLKRGLKNINCFIKIDTGLGRLGFSPIERPENIIPRIFNKCKTLNFAGLLSHAGHSYSAENISEIIEIGRKEENYLFYLKEKLSEFSDNINISTGATPVISVLEDFSADIVRPGNYVFYDNIGVKLGYCDISQCALRVVSQIISKRPGKIIIDAGSKALGTDKGVHSSNIIRDYGIVICENGSDKQNTDMRLSRLSEEHGVIEFSEKNSLKVGDYIEIIPNHSCYTMNLYDNFYIVDKNGIDVIDKLRVDARGKIE